MELINNTKMEKEVTLKLTNAEYELMHSALVIAHNEILKVDGLSDELYILKDIRAKLRQQVIDQTFLKNI